MYQESEQLTANGMELVPFGSDSSTHRETIFKFSEKNGNPMGHEQLREDGHVLVSFARRASNRLSQEDLECLKAYYERKYETPLEVPNEVQKIKKIKICILKKTGIKTEFCAALTRPHAPLDAPSRASRAFTR